MDHEGLTCVTAHNNNISDQRAKRVAKLMCSRVANGKKSKHEKTRSALPRTYASWIFFYTTNFFFGCTLLLSSVIRPYKQCWERPHEYFTQREQMNTLRGQAIWTCCWKRPTEHFAGRGKRQTLNSAWVPVPTTIVHNTKSVWSCPQML